jgi:uncharacterized protein involved in exopolysaccharide biosynthesis/Mrp family chromosome partitioning ATPase
MQMLPSSSGEISVQLASGLGEERFGPGDWRRTAESSPLDVALRRKWVILSGATAAAVLAYVALLFVTPRYTAEADVRVDIPRPQYSGENSAVIPTEQLTAEAVHTEMAVFASPRLAEKAAVDLGLTHRRDYQLCDKAGFLQSLAMDFGAPDRRVCHESVVQAGKVLLDRVAIGTDKVSYIIQVRASDRNADDAARIANGLASAYVDYQRDRKTALAQEADAWLGSQLALVQTAMEKADRDVEQYRQTHSLISLHSDSPGTADTTNGQHFAQLNQELDSVDAAITEKSSTLAQMRGAMAAGAASSAASSLDSLVVQQLLEHHGELAANLAQLRATMGENHPSVQAAAAALHRNEAQVSAEIARSAAALSGQLAALQARRAAIASQIGAATQKVSSESQDRVGLEELQRKAATERTLYESLFVRLKQVDAERRLDVANAAIVVEAAPPDFPVFPRKMLMTVGIFMAALGAGVGGSIFYEFASGRFQGADQLEGEIGLPVLGLFLRRSRAPHDMVVDEPLSIETEAVHGALTQILRTASADGMRSGRSILITSSLPHEGKSSFCVSLGRAAALNGYSVLLLDCDLRRPSVARLLWSAGVPMRRDRMAVPTGPGSATFLDLAQTDVKTPLRYLTLATFYDKPRGLPGWAPFVELWQQAREHYDIVLIDTPPVLATSEAAELAGFADDVVMMVALQETPREAANETVRVLRRAGVSPRGTILSKVDLRRQTERGGLYVKAHAVYAKPVPFEGGISA